MNTLPIMRDPVVHAIRFDVASVTFELEDGRAISAPLVWFPRLRAATPAQRQGWRPIGRGSGVHWPDIDEDISIPALMGQPD